MIGYTLCLAVGIVLGFQVAPKELQVLLTSIEPITLTALVASLLIPFAAFARTEGVQKLLVQYSVVPIFGMYAVMMWGLHGAVGIVATILVVSLHFGYWMSGIHSRAYRLKMAELFLNATGEAKEYARLNARGDAHIADDRIKELFK